MKNKDKINLCILANENEEDHLPWVIACEKFNIKYDVINLTSHDWIEKVIKKKYDYFLSKPPGLTSKFKQLYDERIFILDNIFKLNIYPSPIEIYIYENKRFLYQWLKANNLPHPNTFIFYNKLEAFDFIKKYNKPIVAKINIGASGSGVKILKTFKDKKDYIENAFSKGVLRRWGPNLKLGNRFKRIINYIKNPEKILKKISTYNNIKNDIQKGFVIFQEFIEHDYEWRVVVIGDSFFAHKKLKIGDKASGSLLKNYENPPLYLFDFAKNIMNKFGFVSQAIDIFEPEKEKLLINEMQCIFGQSDPYQMLVDGKPGRYRFVNNKWVFEEGNFTTNACYDLRIKHVLSLINNNCF